MAKIYCKSSYLLRKDTAENWGNKNPVLRKGEQGLETDTGIMKIGDGVTAFNSLSDDNIYLPKSYNKNIDQTYSPTSENAQSGKAVAEAVATEQKRADNTFANALKGSKSGSAILIDDVSPVSHEMSVKISSDTVTDLTAVKVKKQGKNLFNKDAEKHNVILNSDTIKSNNSYKTIFIDIERISDFVLSVYNSSGNMYWGICDSIEVGSTLFSKGILNNTLKCVITNNSHKYIGLSCYYANINNFDLVQFELGTTATDYEQYIAPTEYTPAADGVVNGVTSLYPNTTLATDTNGVIIDCEYNVDLNKGLQGYKGDKGDKGDDGYTPQKGVDYFTPEDIAGLNIPSVDQTYSSTSANAQSGKAVAEAVSTCAKWNEIADGEKIKIVAGVIRNTGDGWSFIENSTHSKTGFVSISTSNSSITLTHNFTAKKILGFSVTPDEDFVQEGYFAGASVGVSSTIIKISTASKEIGGYVYYDETSSEWKTNYLKNINNVSFSNGVLTMTHDSLGSNPQMLGSVTGRDGIRATFGSLGDTSTQVKFYDASGNLITTPTNDCKAYVTRMRRSAYVDPTKVTSGSGNFWIVGVFEVE